MHNDIALVPHDKAVTEALASVQRITERMGQFIGQYPLEGPDPVKDPAFRHRILDLQDERNSALQVLADVLAGAGAAVQDEDGEPSKELACRYLTLWYASQRRVVAPVEAWNREKR